MRRMLVLADVVALAATFALVELGFGAGSGAHHHFGAELEYAVLLATIPGWILIARLYGLYEQDEERTHHPTSDELSRVFHLVTVGVWLLFVGEWLVGAADSGLLEGDGAVGSRNRVRHRRALRRPLLVQAQHHLPPEHGHRRRRRRRPEHRPQDAAAPRVRHQPRRLRRQPAESERQDGLDHVALLGAHGSSRGARPDARRRARGHRLLERVAEETLELRPLAQRRSTSRSTSSRGSSSSSARASRSTRSRALPLIDLPPPRLYALAALVKRTVDVDRRARRARS